MKGGQRYRTGLALLVPVLLAGCSADTNTVRSQALSGDPKGYVAGDGTVQVIPAEQRSTTVRLRGSTVSGGVWDQATEGTGRIVVINVWGQWCPPCVSETDQLQNAWAAVQARSQNVTFVGVNLRDSPTTAAAFLTSHAVTYPSISDQASGGQPSLALQGKAPATPSTLILDSQGRLAGRVLGATTTTTLLAMIDEVSTPKASGT